MEFHGALHTKPASTTAAIATVVLVQQDDYQKDILVLKTPTAHLGNADQKIVRLRPWANGTQRKQPAADVLSWVR